MEPFWVKDNLTGGVRNVQKAFKVILKKDMSIEGPAKICFTIFLRDSIKNPSSFYY